MNFFRSFGGRPYPSRSHQSRAIANGTLTRSPTERQNSETIKFDEFVEKLAEKWCEIPGGSDRGDRERSSDLLRRSDDALLTFWEEQHRAAVELREWYWRLYGDVFRGKKVLEIGSGMGLDAIQFASQGISWTCCDVAPTNLEVISRIARQKQLGISTQHITSIRSFDPLPNDFDVVWCNGSLITLPFSAAQDECAAILTHLKPGGRWVELAYPRERWVREGSPDFSVWGKMTDGEKTPWMEWYDMERLKRRLHPHRLEPILEYRFCSNNFIWLDALYAGKCDTVIESISLEPPNHIIDTPPNLWNFAYSIPIGAFKGNSIAVDIICRIETGSVGFAIERDGRFISRELTVDAAPGDQLIHLSTDDIGANAVITTRNAFGHGSSRFAIDSIILRYHHNRRSTSTAEAEIPT